MKWPDSGVQKTAERSALSTGSKDLLIYLLTISGHTAVLPSSSRPRFFLSRYLPWRKIVRSAQHYQQCSYCLRCGCSPSKHDEQHLLTAPWSDEQWPTSRPVNSDRPVECSLLYRLYDRHCE